MFAVEGGVLQKLFVEAPDSVAVSIHDPDGSLVDASLVTGPGAFPAIGLGPDGALYVAGFDHAGLLRVAAPVPEPASWALLLTGFGLLLARRRFRFGVPARR